MALILCPDCHNNVSTEAAACPHCGRPNEGAAAESPTKPPGKTGHPRRTGCLWIVGILAALTLIGVFSQSTPDRAQAPRSPGSRPTASPPPPAVLAVYAAKAANVRSGPGTTHQVTRKVDAGARLEYVEKAGEWYKLKPSTDGVEEWVHESTVLTEEEKRLRDSAELRLGDWSWANESDYAIAEGQVTNVSRQSLQNVMAVVTFKTESGQFITSDDALVDFDPLLPGQTSPWKVMARWNPAMAKASVQFKTLLGGTLRSYQE